MAGRLTALAALGVLLLAPATRAYDLSSGEKLVTGTCFMCHGQDGTGTSMAPPIRFIADSYSSVGGLANIIQLRMPPPGGSLSVSQAMDAAAYLFELAGKNPASAPNSPPTPVTVSTSGPPLSVPPPANPVTVPPTAPASSPPPTGTYTGSVSTGTTAAVAGAAPETTTASGSRPTAASAVRTAAQGATAAASEGTPTGGGTESQTAGAAKATTTAPPVQGRSSGGETSLFIAALLGQIGLTMLFLGYLYLTHRPPDAPGRHALRARAAPREPGSTAPPEH